MIRRIAAGDRRVMLRMNRWPAPAWIQNWMNWASRAGDGWLWIALGLALLAFGGEEREQAIGAGLVSSGLGLASFLTLKRVTGRERPCSVEPHCWATLLPPDRFSFPSGHTIMAFAIAIPIGTFYPVLMPALLFCALSVAASRVVLGLHYLSDVLAGATIGIGAGLGVLEWLGRL